MWFIDDESPGSCERVVVLRGKKKRRKETKAMGIVLALALVLSITSTGVAQPPANPVRGMSESVRPREDFNVTVNWTTPADGFNAIGLTNYAHATANMNVSGNIGKKDAKNKGRR